MTDKSEMKACDLETLLRTTVPVPAGCVAPEGSPMTPEFRVSVLNVREDGVHFIIHAHGYSGDTLDLIARGNTLMPLALASSRPPADQVPDMEEWLMGLVEPVTKAVLFDDCGNTVDWKDNTNIGIAVVNAIRPHLAALQAMSASEKVREAASELLDAVDAFNANHGRYPTTRISNAAKRLRHALKASKGTGE